MDIQIRFRFWTLISFLFILPTFAIAQIKVDQNIGIDVAISKLVGQGVRVSDIRVNCPSNSGRPYGYFTDNTGTLGISDGLLMTTGSAAFAIGPNNSATKGQSNKNEVEDPDLKGIISSGEKQFDACVIEFNVEVFSDTLTFDYVFGSEEYLEFIKDFHDVFGFFISGPGISGKVNLATVPGTSDPVSVKNINNANNSQYYLDNGTGSTPFDNLFLQYDGFTRRLESKIAVRPCQIYALKLAICDVKDDIYDAGIFIAGRSLRTKAPKLSIRYEHPKFPTAIEGCNGVFVKVTRQSQINLPITFNLTYSGTALQSQDYTKGPDSLVFSPGQIEQEFFISIDADNLNDDNETISIDLINPCPGLPSVDKINIPIRETFPYEEPGGAICLGDSIQLNKNPKPGFTYKWSPFEDLSCSNCLSPWAKPPATKNYFSEIIDVESGCKAADSLKIEVEKKPVADFGFESNENYTSLDVFFKNKSTLANAYNWDFGDGNLSIEKDPFHVYKAEFERDTLTYFISLEAKNILVGCADTASGIVKIGSPLFIPNLIISNNQGLNESFFIKGINPGKWNLEVYNRMGKLVHEDKLYNLDWKAENVGPGVYFFKLSNIPGDRVYTGWIQVLK